MEVYVPTSDLVGPNIEARMVCETIIIADDILSA